MFLNVFLIQCELLKYKYRIYSMHLPSVKINTSEVLIMVNSDLLLHAFRSFIPKFINAIYKCKSISTVGAEQVSREHVDDSLSYNAGNLKYWPLI